MKYTRKQLALLRKRVNESRRFIQVVSGPRQVGKTTLIHQLLDGSKTPHRYVSADNVPDSNPSWIAQQWEIARQKLRSSRARKFILVFDEIQKISNWSEAVKSGWDKDSRERNNIQVIVLGSSKLLLHKGLTESLAGRFEVVHMGHWSFEEMNAAFGLNEDRYAWFGGYPGAVELLRDEQRWKEYIRNSIIETTVSKDILMLTRVDKPAVLRNLFELGSLHSGEILSFTKILGQLQDAGNTTTLANYLVQLTQAGMLTGLEKYSGAITRQRGSIPKFQVFNSAYVSALSDVGFKKISSIPDRWGRIVESAVGAHIVNSTMHSNISVFYWRDGDNEVDFVLKKAEEIVGIEVKSGSGKLAAGAAAFRNRYSPSKVILVGNEGLPWKEFLRINPVELFDR
jgi:predicted AAA+ superfamily ATPase